MKSIFFNFYILMCLGVFSQTPNKSIELSIPLEIIGFNYPDEFTLEFMVNVTALNTQVLSNFLINSSGGFTLSLSGLNCVVSDPIFTTNKWYRISIVKSTDLAIYINGIKTISSLNIPLVTTDSLQLLNGKIDDLRVWNIALNEATIQQNMFKHLSGSETNLVAYLDFDVNTDDLTTNYTVSSTGNILANTTSFSNYSVGVWYGNSSSKNCMFLGNNDLNFNLGVTNFVTENSFTTTVKSPYTLTVENYYFGGLFIDENAGLIQENNQVNFQPVSTATTGQFSEFRYDYWTSAGYKNIVLDYGTPTASETQNIITPISVKTEATIADLFAIGTNTGEHSASWTYAMHGGVPYGEVFTNTWSSNPTNRGLHSGLGFTLKGALGSLTSNALKTFSTVPENGTVAIDFSHIPNDDVLIGNPFPSAISLKEFIQQNQSSMEGYIEHWLQWDGNSHASASFVGGYATQNLLGTSLPNAEFLYNMVSLLPKENITQRKAFLIWTTPIVSTIEFNNSMRIKSDVIEDNSTKNRFWVSLKKNLGTLIQTDQLLIGATSTSTNGLDYGYDASYYHDSRATLIYSFITGDTPRYKIQSIENTFTDDVKIGVKIGEIGNYIFKLQLEEQMSGADDILLIDTQTSLEYDLRAIDATINFNTTGVFDNRFLIRFKETVLSIVDNEIDETLYVWQDATHIHIETSKPLKRIQLIDINGKVVNEFKNTLIPKANLPSGVYLIKFYSVNNQIQTKKIILK